MKVVTECEPLSGEKGSMPAGCVSWMTSKTLISWDTGFEERTSHSSIGNLFLCMKKTSLWRLAVCTHPSRTPVDTCLSLGTRTQLCTYNHMHMYIFYNRIYSRYLPVL